MSCFFIENENHKVADYVAILTCPLWFPFVCATFWSAKLHMKYQKRRHHNICHMLADRLLPYAHTVQIGDGYLCWKHNTTIYLIQVVYEVYTHVYVTSILRDFWTKGTNFVLAAVYDIKHITQEYIQFLEETCIPTCTCDKDTIVVRSPCHVNIGNAIVSKLSDGYYGIIANKFNIVFQTGCQYTTNIAFKEDFAREIIDESKR